MSTWTAGYRADVGYSYGYYAEMNPLRLQLVFLNAGLLPPVVGAACELGFGQGICTNMHAAASVVQWAGTDINPSHAGFAQDLARVADSGAKLYDESFEQFCQRSDLPDFDYIALHGIWSWVSDENRAVIVDFIRRKLKVGGVLYVSYNTQPGWAAMVPLRDLLLEHAEVLGSNGAGIVNRIESALGFAEQLLTTNPAYARANPQIGARLQYMKAQDRHYLAHEYFNRDWQPMAFAKMAQWLEPAKLQWACSAHCLDAVDVINLTPEQQKMLADIPDRMFRQTTRDFCVNQSFRKDYWVKGARQLTWLEQVERLRIQRVVLVRPRAEVVLKVIGNAGEATLQESLYGPVLDLLADHKPKTLAFLEQQLEAQNMVFAQILEVVMVLMGMGVLAPAQDETVVAKVKKHTDRLNTYLMSKVRSNNDLKFLVSPVTGGGILVERFEQLFLRAKQQGHQTPAEWAKFVWSLLDMQGQRLGKDGQSINSEEESIQILLDQAELFAEKRLPMLKALQIA